MLSLMLADMLRSIPTNHLRSYMKVRKITSSQISDIRIRVKHGENKRTFGSINYQTIQALGARRI